MEWVGDKVLFLTKDDMTSDCENKNINEIQWHDLKYSMDPIRKASYVFYEDDGVLRVLKNRKRIII